MNRAWTTQRVANRLPPWSKAREEDSAFQVLINPICFSFDHMWSELAQIKLNYFIGSADVKEINNVYILQLPYDFEFEQAAVGVGFSWVKPTVIGDGETVIILDDWTDLDKKLLTPTRLVFDDTLVSVSDTVVGATNLADVSEITIFNTDGLELLGQIYLDIDNAEVFGETLNNGTVISPKVVITGERIEDKYLDETIDHVPFSTNTQQPSSVVWSDLTSLEVRGIYGDSGTLTITYGLNKDFVQEPYAIIVTDNGEQSVSYTLDSVDGLSIIGWATLEVIDPNTIQNGHGDKQIVYDACLLVDDVEVSNIIALERQPFSPWLLVLTDTQLHWVNAGQPGTAFLSTLYTKNIVDRLWSALWDNKDYSPEIIWEASSVNTYWFDSGVNELTIRRHAYSYNCQSIRLSRYYIVADVLIKEYVDFSNQVINITTHDTQGFIPVPSEWTNIRLDIDMRALNTYAMVWVLEAQLESGVLQKDSILIYLPVVIPTKTFDLVDQLQNSCTGMTFNYRGDLYIRHSAGTLYSVDFFWDYGVVNYRENLIYLKESYSTVEVETNV